MMKLLHSIIIDCKCSNLSESIQCDETGQCSCLEVGRGLKCDECSFGHMSMTHYT